MPYEPKLLDLTRVQILADLTNLVEQLAEITHDNWLRQRLADGWRHGQSRNDLLKEHPCIVPYDDLPESEKEYDRKISLGVIQAMLALDTASNLPQVRRYPARHAPCWPMG